MNDISGETMTTQETLTEVVTSKEIASAVSPSADNELGLVIGRVVSFDSEVPMVLFEYNGEHFCLPVFSSLTPLLPSKHLGVAVCLGFAESNLSQPIVLGILHSQPDLQSGNLVIQSDMGITLKCGKASIQLKKDGTVSIRGTNVASRASQTNRIRGGNVQIN